MKRAIILMLTAGALMALFATEINAQRGGRGGGGGGSRGGGGGGFSAPARQAPQAARPAPQAARPAPQAARPTPQAARPAAQSGTGTRTPITGPAGGTGQAGKGSGSYTTKGGSTVDYKGAAIGGTGAGGTTGGKYVGGVSVTTPGGQTVNRAGKGAAATGPGGNSAASKSNITRTTGPAGTGASASRTAVAAGVGGAVGGMAGIATGPGGTAAGRAGVATGPGGTAAARSGAAVTSTGTYYRSAAAVSNQGAYVRSGFAQQYPGLAVRWAGFTYRPITWAALASYGGYPAESCTSYDYGSSTVYQDGSVYVDGEAVATAEEYAEQATAIAETATQAPPAKEEDYQPLGVYAMVMGEETTSYNIFQLSLSKDGVLKGSYYNALTDSTEPVTGAVDKKTQRAAWIVGDKKMPTYEAGIINLAQEECTMMVHYSKDRSQQFTLVRIQQPEGEAPPASPPAKDGK